MTNPTLIEHIRLTERRHPEATGELSRILSRLSLGARMIAQRLLNAGFLGEHGDTGQTNVQGETVQKLDELADRIFVRVFETLPGVAAVASEERSKIHAYDDEEAQRGKYVVLYDPLDGSGNIDINGSLGSIFSVHERVTDGGPVTDLDFLQPGARQVVAGYVLYGPATVFVYTARDEAVNGFTLDRSIGEFFLTHPKIRIPDSDGAASYSVNESNEPSWDDKVKALVASFRQGRAPVGKRAARYTGALVADFHRTLLKGGIFMYPPLAERPRGKLRYLYEAAPLALVAERAGGVASDGHQRLLDLKPQSLHERCPLFIGSRPDVEYACSQLT